MKLIAVDVDGTLLNSKNEISPKTKEALITPVEVARWSGVCGGR